jgi:hypothetical protein
MVCVQFSSVIDATGEGVHARNPQRLFFDNRCELLAFRLKAGLTDSQADQVCQFVRQTIGAEYSKMEAVRSVLGGSDQWTRKQFCSRLVAQAYASAGILLVEDPNYCSPADLARSALLVAIPNVVETVTEGEAVRWAAHGDATATMREAINAVLEGARKKDPNIQTLNDVDSHLIKHPEHDAYLADVYIASGYLTVWRTRQAVAASLRLRYLAQRTPLFFSKPHHGIECSLVQAEVAHNTSRHQIIRISGAVRKSPCCSSTRAKSKRASAVLGCSRPNSRPDIRAEKSNNIAHSALDFQSVWSVHAGPIRGQ